MKKLFVLFCLTILVVVSFAQKPKYIFLFIGDGMGLVQTKVSDDYLRATQNDSVVFMQFPNTGMQTTHSLSSKITCSAAAGTAIACGEKTKAGYIGIDAQGVDSFPSIAKIAKMRGYGVGIVSSVSIDHATPATFYAHDTSRNNYFNIAMQLPKSGFHFFAGGQFLQPTKDSISVFTELQKQEYTVLDSPQTLPLVSTVTNNIIILDTIDNKLSYGIDKNPQRFTLEQFTQASIESLELFKQGFFIMIEGGSIDWACHANDIGTMVNEVSELNKSVKKAVEFYEKHPKETLIIVTGDHETGGLAYGSALYPYYTNISLLSAQTKSAEFVTKELQQVLSKTALFTFKNCMEFLDSYFVLNKDNGVSLTEFDSLRLQRAFQFTMSKSDGISDTESKMLYNISTSEKNPEKRCSSIITVMNTIIAEKAGISWSTFAHSGTPIPVYAKGVGAHKFSGYYDNTDIFYFLLQLLK